MCGSVGGEEGSTGVAVCLGLDVSVGGEGVCLCGVGSVNNLQRKSSPF